MKVVLIHPFDAFGGSQRMAATLAQALVELGMRLEFHLGFGSLGFVSKCTSVKRFSGINYIPFRKLLYPFWILSMWPRMIVSSIRGDLIWANTVHAIPAVIPALCFAPHNVVLHLHEINFPRLFYSLASWSTRRGGRILCVSDLHRQELKLKADVLFNCVNVHSDQVAVEPPVLLFVGAMSELKGFDLFVEVVRVLKPGLIRALAFVPCQPKAAHAQVEAALKAGIHIRYGVTDPNDIYPGATLLLQCTDPALATETFSLVMVEALGCGVPVATTGMKVAGEILSDAWAFDIPSRDPDLIAANIQNFLASPQRLDLLRSAAKRRREHFTYAQFKNNVSFLLNGRPSKPRNSYEGR